jgi:glycerophosphoryl diester phosphodiesterase
MPFTANKHRFMAQVSALSFVAGVACTPSDEQGFQPEQSALAVTSAKAKAARPGQTTFRRVKNRLNVQLGPRPYYLVSDMDEGPLKERLEACSEQRPERSDFSIGHRGAPLQFPEHTKESYEAAGRMGAGIVECDVTFTKDRQLVCRHAQCDLHTTTNILAIPELAAKCRVPFTPADPASGRDASAQCCTSDVTLAEFKTLCGKMDAFDPKGRSVEEYMNATPRWRTDLYATCGTVLSHQESIELIDGMGLKFTPELKAPEVEMPFQGDYTQAAYAQQLVDEYKAARVRPERVFAQSFNLNDVLYWLDSEPAFGRQAVYLDDRVDQPGGVEAATAGMRELAARGVRIVAPPMWALLTRDAANRIVPSAYARAARAAGLDLITWTLERSGPLASGGGYYYQSLTPVIDSDGDMLTVLDVLAKKVGIRGIFSDWPATVTYYANCMGLK